MTEKAIEKIEQEMKSFKGDKYGQAVGASVAEALKDFARQDGEFAQAIIQNDKTVSDCCAQIMKGVGGSVSDIEVYRRAAAFYFPGATVRFQMMIDLCPAPGAADDATKPVGIVLDLADFLS